MGNFNRNRFGGGGRRDFSMHKAICSKCGSQCEVPFKPSGSKPVYCSKCFEGNRNSDPGRFERRNFDRPNFEDRRMYDAVCDECGKNCSLPFQPKNGKPVYCSQCFEGKGDRGSRNTQQYKEQFEKLNAKLDKILKFLTPVIAPIKEPKVKKETKKKKTTAKK